MGSTGSRKSCGGAAQAGQPGRRGSAGGAPAESASTAARTVAQSCAQRAQPGARGRWRAGGRGRRRAGGLTRASSPREPPLSRGFPREELLRRGPPPREELLRRGRPRPLPPDAMALRACAAWRFRRWRPGCPVLPAERWAPGAGRDEVESAASICMPARRAAQQGAGCPCLSRALGPGQDCGDLGQLAGGPRAWHREGAVAGCRGAADGCLGLRSRWNLRPASERAPGCPATPCHCLGVHAAPIQMTFCPGKLKAPPAGPPALECAEKPLTVAGLGLGCSPATRCRSISGIDFYRSLQRPGHPRHSNPGSDGDGGASPHLVI